MYKVIASHPPKQDVLGPGMHHAPTTTESGPFEDRDTAERFAVGLAKSGQAYRAEIVAVDLDPGELILEAYRVLQTMHPPLKVGEDRHLVVAMEHLTASRGALHKHDGLATEIIHTGEERGDR
jgi:hypothetical protein